MPFRQSNVQTDEIGLSYLPGKPARQGPAFLARKSPTDRNNTLATVMPP